MTLNERIAYAEGRLDEAIKNKSNEDILYWRGYKQGLVAHKTALERTANVQKEKGAESKLKSQEE